MSKTYFGGGCFWCMEAIFQRVNGVKQVRPGYMGGINKNPTYKEVCTGKTGHAEVVEIKFENKVIDFDSLLSIFFSTHNPTTLNRQGNDIGTQYRSIIFCTDNGQITSVHSFIKSLEKKRIFSSPIVTKVISANIFYSADEKHFNYYNQNSNQLYCSSVIQPKLRKFMLDHNKSIKNN